MSAWFYAGHNPNNDAFQVRPEFLKIRKGRLPRVGYEEYVQMQEYRNVQSRMLGANSFPYRDIEVNRTVQLHINTSHIYTVYIWYTRLPLAAYMCTRSKFCATVETH